MPMRCFGDTTQTKYTCSSSPVHTPPLSERKLVTVRRISDITSTSERGWKEIHVDGWTVLKSRNEAKNYQVGDLILFVEIDSFLPRTAQFEDFFTNPKYIKQDVHGNDGVIVDSIVIGKHLSQGLVLSLDDFPKIINYYQRKIEEVGFTLATRDLESRSFEQMLGVTKWTHPNEYLHEPLHEMGNPPAFIVNPIWERVQNMHDLWTSPAQQKRLWQVTEKMDGITMQVYKVDLTSTWISCIPEMLNGYPQSMRSDGCHIGVCSRKRDYYDTPDSIFWRVGRASGVVARIRDIPYPNIAIQGELVGSSILDNTMKYPADTHEYIVFSIFNLDTGKYLHPEKTVTLCRDLGIQHVPVTGYFKLRQLARSTEELLKKADSLGPGRYGGLKEGWVFRATDGAQSFKVISNRWLKLANGE
ncbi:RNA ligase-domain-containing protein [Podospora conica]|nr:RNA ligase-domain-containing protein [Schizothecium conicum]